SPPSCGRDLYIASILSHATVVKRGFSCCGAAWEQHDPCHLIRASPGAVDKAEKGVLESAARRRNRIASRAPAPRTIRMCSVDGRSCKRPGRATRLGKGRKIGGRNHGYVWEGGVGGDSCPDCTGSKGVAGPHDQGKQDRDPARGDPGKGIVVFDVHPNAASQCDGGAEAAGGVGCRG